MKENELRIGNWINVGGELNQFDIADFCDIFDNGNKWFKDLFKPIPLNEEWLVKFGFVSNPYADRYELADFYIEHNAERGYSIFWFDKTGTTLEYVHQLQNLYFALTGEELEIK